jgi:hypothetical protein
VRFPIPYFRVKLGNISCFDIRGIGDNEVKARCTGKGSEQVGTKKVDSLLQIVRGNILAGDIQGFLREIAGNDFTLREFFAQDNSDNTAASAEVENALWWFIGMLPKCS